MMDYLLSREERHKQDQVERHKSKSKVVFAQVQAFIQHAASTGCTDIFYVDTVLYFQR